MAKVSKTQAEKPYSFMADAAKVRASSRADGTNPRALETNPRAVAAKQTTEAIRQTPKGRAETAAEKAANATTGGSIVPIKRSALSQDVGLRIISEMFGDEKRIDEMIQEQHLLGSKRKHQLSELSQAVIKAALADETIDLTATFSGDKKAMGKLNDQLGIVLGFREVVSRRDTNGVEYQRVDYAERVKDYFPMPGEKETDAPNYQQRKTFRGNFLTQLKLCAQFAFTAIETNSEVKLDQKAGTLMLSGPAIKKHFGQERVLLDEKRSVGEGDDKRELAAKPSFAEIARMGAALYGVQPTEAGVGGEHHRGKQVGTVGGTLAVQAAKAADATAKPTGKEDIGSSIVWICDSLARALANAKGELSKAAIAALEEIQNAIEVRLAN
jgi:hypothetical protein